MLLVTKDKVPIWSLLSSDIQKVITKKEHSLRIQFQLSGLLCIQHNLPFRRSLEQTSLITFACAFNRTMWFVGHKFSHANLKRNPCYQVLCAQICIKRKCNWYFIVKPKEGGNTWKRAEEDRLGLSSEPAPDLSANKNMLCGVQISWHGWVKQRAATASHTSPGRDTHHSVCCQVHTYCQNNVTALQGTIHQSFGLQQVSTLKPLSHIHAEL